MQYMVKPLPQSPFCTLLYISLSVGLKRKERDNTRIEHTEFKMKCAVHKGSGRGHPNEQTSMTMKN